MVYNSYRAIYNVIYISVIYITIDIHNALYIITFVIYRSKWTNANQCKCTWTHANEPMQMHKMNKCKSTHANEPKWTNTNEQMQMNKCKGTNANAPVQMKQCIELVQRNKCKWINANGPMPMNTCWCRKDKPMQMS